MPVKSALSALCIYMYISFVEFGEKMPDNFNGECIRSSVKQKKEKDIIEIQS